MEATQCVGIPLKYFKDYLQHGYYPFGRDEDYFSHLQQIVVQTMESDIPAYANMNVATGRKLLKLLILIADSVPFYPLYAVGHI
ncbi:MAG: hypothetical protein LBN23_05035 [Paludibacter sp.]|jgi:hypothetical protein|nr:hypothetical protein [Paludibacter sp.]